MRSTDSTDYPNVAKVEDAAGPRRPLRQAQGEAVVCYAGYSTKRKSDVWISNERGCGCRKGTLAGLKVVVDRVVDWYLRCGYKGVGVSQKTGEKSTKVHCTLGQV
jgi:hypothetical protein